MSLTIYTVLMALKTLLRNLPLPAPSFQRDMSGGFWRALDGVITYKEKLEAIRF